MRHHGRGAPANAAAPVRCVGLGRQSAPQVLPDGVSQAEDHGGVGACAMDAHKREGVCEGTTPSEYSESNRSQQATCVLPSALASSSPREEAPKAATVMRADGPASHVASRGLAGVQGTGLRIWGGCTDMRADGTDEPHPRHEQLQQHAVPDQACDGGGGGGQRQEDEDHVGVVPVHSWRRDEALLAAAGHRLLGEVRRVEGRRGDPEGGGAYDTE